MSAMKISTRGRYAVRVMVDLALHDSGECVKVKQIADRQELSEKYLEQIIAILNKAGFVKSVRGAQGGYRLTKDPSEYTVGEILRLTEGCLNPVPCLDDGCDHLLIFLRPFNPLTIHSPSRSHSDPLKTQI